MRLILLILLLLPFLGHARNPTADSLFAALSHAQTDSERVVLHNSLSKHFLMSDAHQAQQHGQEAARLATASGLKAEKAKALNLVGISYLVNGAYDKAVLHHLEALQVAQQLDAVECEITSYINLGNAYLKLEEEKRALQSYRAGLALAKKINNKLLLSKIYCNLGALSEKQKQYAEAMRYYRKSADLQKALHNKRAYAVSLLNIGNLHLYTGQPEKGLPYLFQSLRLDQEANDQVTPIATRASIARLYMAAGKPTEALKYGQQSYEAALATGSGKKKAAAAQLMQELYAGRHDYQRAYTYQTQYLTELNKLNLENQMQVATETAIRYETEAKEQENQDLKAEQKKQDMAIRHQQVTLLLGCAILFLLLVLLAVLYLSRQRVREAYDRLKDTHRLMQVQQHEIIRQTDELCEQAEKLRAQNEQLEKHKQFRTKIFSIISHDLRNPFNGIKGVLNIVQQRALPENQMKHVFGLLSRDVEAATNMLDNVLVWSKAQLDETQVLMHPVSLRELVQENVQLAAAQAAEKSIRFSQDVSEDAMVLADRERLNFVVRNLLMNAVKFTYEGGLIAVQTEVREKNVVLTVSDNGKGIPAKYLEKLFTKERFTTPGTLNEKGSGLGLMLCMEFIESLQGSLRVESEEGRGSTFELNLQRSAHLCYHTEAPEAELLA